MERIEISCLDVNSSNMASPKKLDLMPALVPEEMTQ